MIDRKKVLLSLVVLATLVASFAAVVGKVGSGAAVHAQQAQATSVTSTEYQVPQGDGNNAWGTASDSNGNVWVALPGCDFSPTCSSNTPGQIIRFNPSNNSWSSAYKLPSGYGQPIFLAFDPSGNLWFTMPSTNSLGELNPSNNNVQQFTVPTASSGPWGIAVNSHGVVWFTEHYTNKIGSYNPSTHAFHEIATSKSNTQPYGITVDKSDNVWFAENNPSFPGIGEETAGGTLREFPITPQGTSITPHLITIDTNGNPWWSEGWIGKIGELKIAQGNSISQYSYNRSGTHTSGIGVDGFGNVWFDDSIQSIYGSFPESTTGSFTLYNTPSSQAHPHDGLHVDGQNRIWFNEQFANKLVRVDQPGSGSSTPTPTPTSTKPTTPTPTATTPTTTGQVVAKDNFQRPNQTYWGKASDGQTWTSDSSTLNSFTITSNTGTVSNAGSNTYSAILGPTETNAQVLVSGSLNTFTNTNFGAILRWTDGSNWYKAFIDGSTFGIQKKVAGNATILKSVSFAAKANTSYTIRFQVSGTTLNAKVWATGSAEPSGWTVTASDNTFASGHVGIRILTQGGKATFTSFQATTI